MLNKNIHLIFYIFNIIRDNIINYLKNIKTYLAFEIP